MILDKCSYKRENEEILNENAKFPKLLGQKK